MQIVSCLRNIIHTKFQKKRSRYINKNYDFFFQVLLEMSPGMGVDKSILSVADLKSHSKDIGHWGPQELISALLKDGFSAKLKNPLTGEFETLCDLICFGSSEVGNLLAKFNR